MPWFRVDDSFYDHPKVFDAPDCAVALWTRAGTWCARSLTNGYVPTAMIARFCSDPEKAARELVRRGLWLRVKGGYQYHDWPDYQPTKEVVENERKHKAERQKRWREAKRRRLRDADVDASTGASRNASQDDAPPPPRPAPKEAGRAGPAPDTTAANGRASPAGPPARGGTPKPPWCGTCDELTRQIGDPPARCPACHPLAAEPKGRHTAAARAATHQETTDAT
ncbi:MAG TPA: hypothetical protein VIX86_11370 [Streptosporangiaceae bacterium]